MRIQALIFTLCAASALYSQTPAAPKAAPAPAKPATPAVPTAARQQVSADLLQVMRGIIYPASNVIFAAQDVNPNDVKPAKDPAMAVNPLESAYGKWTAVENAGLALSEAANLLMIPGRKCSNGNPVPMTNGDWPKFVEELRAAGKEVYKVAQSKNQEDLVDKAAEAMTNACSHCHDKYRDVKFRCK